MALTLTVALGISAGLHAATYGAYKDSPHESFLPRRFIRELVIAAGCALALGVLHLADAETPFVVFLSAFALSRIVTEFWKLFVRTEPQGDYRIPTQIHWFKGVIHNRALRLSLGFGFLAALYGIYTIATVLPADAPAAVRGALVGLAVGLSEAIAGGYKDGSVEGFSFVKFLKSPAFGLLGGLVAAGHTDNPVSLVLATIGTMRMLLELIFKIVVPGYVPGKFRSMTGPFSRWQTRRRIFLPAYAATWAVYLVLATRPNLTPVRLLAAGPAPHSTTDAAAPVCPPSASPSAQWQYTVRGRIRPLLVWTGRHEVGAARFVRRETGPRDRSLELTIGTDPSRAPMRLNRWGYVAETLCGARADLIGLMTQSDETEIADAVNITAASGGQPFKAIRARQLDGVVETELFRLAPPDSPTFNQVEEVLGRLPAAREGKRMATAAGVDPGFLVALTGLIHDSVTIDRQTGRLPSGLRRRYVYDGKVYELTANVSRLPELAVNGRAYRQALEGEFRIRNTMSGSTTDFRVAFDADPRHAEVPLRAVYRPRWWLELELSLQ